jgi:hypothetical protein
MRNAKTQTLIELVRAILRPHCQRQLRARRFASLLTEPKRPAPQPSTAMRGQYSNINDPPALRLAINQDSAHRQRAPRLILQAKNRIDGAGKFGRVALLAPPILRLD